MGLLKSGSTFSSVGFSSSSSSSSSGLMLVPAFGLGLRVFYLLVDDLIRDFSLPFELEFGLKKS